MHLNLDRHSIEYLSQFSSIASRYDAFLVDIWGVLHDSAKTYPGAVHCLKQLKASGKSIILVSNAARRSAKLAEELLVFGITPEHYDHIVSSGEVAWNEFKSRKNQQLEQLGSNYYLLGSMKYRLTEGLDIKPAREVAQADFLLAIGVSGNPQDTSSEEPVLQQAARLNLPMVCANPDLKVVRDGVMGIASGAVAQSYQELGGSVIYFGKPHPDIYHSCFRLLKGIYKERIAAVGDALNTDIAGANSVDIDSILITTGIYEKELSGLPDSTTELLELCKKENQFPTTIIKAFSW